MELQTPLMADQSPVAMKRVSSKKNQLPKDDEMFIYNTREYSASAYEIMQKARAEDRWYFIPSLLLHWKGGLWQAVLGELIVFLTVYYIIWIIVEYGITESQGKTFDEFSEMAIYMKNCGVVPLSFLLGFFNTAVYSRWKDLWNTLWWPDGLSMALIAAFPKNNEDHNRIRSNIARWCFLTSVIGMGDCTFEVGKKWRPYNVMVAKGWMTIEEVALFKKTLAQMPHGSSWWIPCDWAVKLLAQCDEAGMISNPMRYNTLYDQIMQMRAKVGTMWDIYITGVPILYMQTVAFATYSYIILILLGQSQFPDDEEWGLVNYYVPIWSILEIMLYLGWLKLSLRLIDPFGRLCDDDVAFDIDWILHRNFEVLICICENAEVLPGSGHVSKHELDMARQNSHKRTSFFRH